MNINDFDDYADLQSDEHHMLKREETEERFAEKEKHPSSLKPPAFYTKTETIEWQKNEIERLQKKVTKHIDQSLAFMLERDRERIQRDEARATLNEIRSALYGKGFMVAGWHLNGNLEPLDSFFEENDWLENNPQ